MKSARGVKQEGRDQTTIGFEQGGTQIGGRNGDNSRGSDEFRGNFGHSMMGTRGCLKSS